MKNYSQLNILHNPDKSIQVMLSVSQWMKEKGLNPSQWWQPQYLTKEFLLKRVKPEEFFVGIIDGVPAASMILQETEWDQSWKKLDGSQPQQALYIQWLCVARQFAGQGLSRIMIDVAAHQAQKRGNKFLRLDTDAHQKKLCDLYESLGFQLVCTQTKNKQMKAFYQKSIG